MKRRSRPILLLVLLLVLVLFALPGRALAHAHLVRADLAPNSHLRVSVGTVRFWFDEPLTPALSRILILNRQGQQVTTDTGTLNPQNDEELDLTVPTLPDGVYSVRWTSASAQDGHVMHGFYLFTVGGPGAVAPPSVPAAIGAAGASLDAAGVAGALARWLVLAATALWTGVLALYALVLAPAAVATGPAQQTLAGAALRRARPLLWWGLCATLLATALEAAVQAGDAAGGPGGLPDALSAIMSTSYGAYLLARAVLLALALLVLLGAARASGLPWRRGSSLAEPPLRPLTSRVLLLLGLAYLGALALSGHAATVPHMTLTAVVLDWLHLVAMTVWIGGMAAIALLLVPARGGRGDLLDLLDRFSPAAYVAVGALAATGLFNAQTRLSGPALLTSTLYGQLLLIKLALVAVLMAVSATHVFWTRPRLRRALSGAAQPPGPALTRGFASLAARLRFEPALGALLLLCVALMQQVAPGASAFDATVVQVVNEQGSTVTGGPIAASGSLGALTVNLQINPADIGQAQVTAAVAERGHPVADGQVRIKFTMPAHPELGAAFVETAPSGGAYTGTADLVQEGLWRADVLVRTRDDPLEFRDVPFVFVASGDPILLSPPRLDPRDGPATLRLNSPPGTAATLSVRLRAGLRVRYLVTMPDMSPQEDGAAPAGGGWYRGVIVPPMEGYMNLAIQVWTPQGWRTVRTAVAQVDANYAMFLLA
jgi:copper transport protein